MDSLHYDKILLLKQLQMPDDILNIILIKYKYDMLDPKYKFRYTELINHMQYYMWLNKKLNKKDKANQSLLKTIKEFDYYQP